MWHRDAKLSAKGHNTRKLTSLLTARGGSKVAILDVVPRKMPMYHPMYKDAVTLSKQRVYTQPNTLQVARFKLQTKISG
jgi:hypothetical protein